MTFFEIIKSIDAGKGSFNICHKVKGYVLYYDNGALNFSYAGSSVPEEKYYKPYHASVVEAIIRAEDGKLFDSPNVPQIGRTGSVVIPLEDFLDDCWELGSSIEKSFDEGEEWKGGK